MEKLGWGRAEEKKSEKNDPFETCQLKNHNRQSSLSLHYHNQHYHHIISAVVYLVSSITTVRIKFDTFVRPLIIICLSVHQMAKKQTKTNKRCDYLSRTSR